MGLPNFIVHYFFKKSTIYYTGLGGRLWYLQCRYLNSKGGRKGKKRKEKKERKVKERKN